MKRAAVTTGMHHNLSFILKMRTFSNIHTRYLIIKLISADKRNEKKSCYPLHLEGGGWPQVRRGLYRTIQKAGKIPGRNPWAIFFLSTCVIECTGVAATVWHSIVSRSWQGYSENFASVFGKKFPLLYRFLVGI